MDYKEKLTQEYQASIAVFTKKLYNVEPLEVTGLVNWVEYKDMLKAARHLADCEE